MIAAMRSIVFMIIVGAAVSDVRAPQPPIPANCQYPVRGPNGEVNMICMPKDSSKWNKKFVLYAHGYDTPLPGKSVDLPWEQMCTEKPFNVCAWDVLGALRFGFGATSYRKLGLAVVEGQEDMLNLVDHLKTEFPKMERVYAMGFSMGGLVTTLLQEKHPDVFRGSIAACSPVGDLRKQIQYWGDFRVLFDYFFPKVLPGNAISVPQDVLIDWVSENSTYQQAVADAVNANTGKAETLLKMLGITPPPPNHHVDAVLDVLRFQIMVTQEDIDEFSAQPYDNRHTIYKGSDNDLHLNLFVQRFGSKGDVQAALAPYETSGKLEKPLLLIHTRYDPIVPFNQLVLYVQKVWSSGFKSAMKLLPIPVGNGFRHCKFFDNPPEQTEGLINLLDLKATGKVLTREDVQQVVPDLDVEAYMELNPHNA